MKDFLKIKTRLLNSKFNKVINSRMDNFKTPPQILLNG